MSDKVIRITSQQGFAAQWTNAEEPKTLSLVDFTIPSGLVVNMAKSYISFNSSISNNVDEVVNASWWLGVHGTDQFNVPNAALIRNCSISASSVGQMESIIRQDSLACGMWGLAHTAEEKKSDMNTLSAFNNGAGDSVYTSLNLDRISNNVTNDGSTIMTGLNGSALTSNNIDRDLKIPLKDIFGVGAVEDFDTSKWGEVDIHCETNLKLLKSHQWGGDEDTLFGFDGTTPQGIMEPITLAAINDTVTTVTTGTTYGEWEYTLPFYVGQTVSLSADSTQANPPADELGVIASIQFQNNNSANPPTGGNKVIITFEDAIYTAAIANTQLSDILVKAVVDDTDLVNTINRAELVLYVSDETETADAYEYMTYTSEQDNGNGLTSFNRGYMLEPTAENVMVACMNDNMILPTRTITSYRYSIDNDEQTGNRDIVSNSPLQYDRLQRCLNVSAQIPFKDAQLKFYKQTNTQAEAYASPISMICETLQTNGQSRMLNLSIESTGLQQIILYKQLPRQISI